MKTQKKKLNGDGTVFYLEKERKWRAEITWVDGGGNKHRKSWKATKQADVKEKLASLISSAEGTPIRLSDIKVEINADKPVFDSESGIDELIENSK